MLKYRFALFCLTSILVVLLFAPSTTARLNTGANPQWRNQIQDTLAIPQGSYVALQADGRSTLPLEKAVLSTNETGSWKNETSETLLWMQSTVHGFDNFGTATYKDGVLYAPSKDDNKVYAVNATDGAVIWNTTVRQCDTSPCIDGDIIFVGECRGPNGEPTPFPRAIALNRTNGEEIWHFTEPNDSTWVGSPVVDQGYVYYTTLGSGVYALNKTNGSVLWNQNIGSIVCSVAYDEDKIFVSAYDPEGQYAFNATTGQQIWHQTYGRSWDTSPVIYMGMIIQVEFNSTERLWSTYVLNETDGKLIREFEGKGSTGTPLVHNGNVFIPSNDWKMWAFDLATGTELWHTMELHNGMFQDLTYCSPAAAGGAIYCQSLNGTFYVINETDGNVIWSYALASLGFGSPSIGDGVVFITNDGGLYAFSIGLGSGDWPMFCSNNLHRSVSESGVEYLRYPLTEPRHLGETSGTWVTAKFVWCNVTIVSAAIAWRIYFFDGIGNTNATDVRIFFVNMSIHNVAVIEIAPKEMLIEQNQITSFNVTVVNSGNFTETFNVTLFYDVAEIGLQALTLNAGESRILVFEWNTIGISSANYTLSAHASAVMQEAEMQDNDFVMQHSIVVVAESMSTLALLLGAIISTSIVVASIEIDKRYLHSARAPTKK